MEDKIDQKVAKVSKDVINQLAVVIKTSQLHDPTNVAVVKSLEKILKMVNWLVSTGPINMELVGDYFYVNETRMKIAMEQLVNFDYLVREFKKHDLGSITFSGPIDINGIQNFLKLFISSSFSEEPFVALEEGMVDVGNISVGKPRKIQDKDVNTEVDPRKTVKKTYFNAVSFTKGVMNRIRSGERINVKRSKRVVQSLVDTLLSEEELLFGMTAIKDYDDYTYHHSVNVSILSVSLGQRLGFDKNILLELGLVSLFHDIGKIEIPPEVLNKPGSFTEDEWKTVRRHPFWGVRAILDMKSIDDISIRTAIVAFEHHQHLNHSGYPKVRVTHKLDLFSRIVSIADQYESMTSARVYMRGPLPAEKALSIMAERTGTQLDPLLFKFFVNMVGVYPVGTAVMLDSMELGLVTINNIMFPDRPKVLVITDPKGKKLERGYVVDLTEKVSTGQFKRSVRKLLDPHKYKINLAEYLL
jgi:HD-GYP domain-containing protein (c-di-GMP phosphodiesterase class II)